MLFTLIIPAYNEGKKIRRDLEEVVRYLKQQDFDSEIIVASDGSRDDTCEVVQKARVDLSSPKVNLRLLSVAENRGKGFGVRWGVQESRGEIVGFMDVGLCVPVRYLKDGIGKIQAGYDYAIASRGLAQTEIRTPAPLYRRIGSKVFRRLMRLFMGIKVSDTQCGFKFYSSSAAKDIFSRLKTDGFMFDVEALLIASKLKLKGTEFAVEWSNDDDSRLQLISGNLRNIRDLLKIRYRTLIN